mmetsp:Transcript_10949/g.21421  ORF Transcript_10949/g.21421 Transcript_10949/m.21421 type:complete len:283 (-) Transcript_10949:1056-1904(-)|eukprot:CAMPEP_0171524872 /NCGR_PEP_ID=MMETSP0959-20130129/9336_1 /TAXON_ID=87120 /ORGANISM="Aurantiochytrium limacinum, Strain ATCCMYA-1381" /LENGTH=282 /DNA_ID=CAMNT_0012065747 /DNA_START=58 /DNA_END=906 /DNA_ORIENTATION=-
MSGRGRGGRGGGRGGGGFLDGMQTPRPPFEPPATYPARKRRWRSQHEDWRLRFLSQEQRDAFLQTRGGEDTAQNAAASQAVSSYSVVDPSQNGNGSSENEDQLPSEVTKMVADQWERVHWDVDFKERLKSSTTNLHVPNTTKEVETWDAMMHAKFEMGCTDIATTLTRPLSLLYVPGELAPACVPKTDEFGNLISLAKATPATRGHNPNKRKAVNVLARMEAREAKDPGPKPERKNSADEEAEGSSAGEEEVSDDGDYGLHHVDDDDDDFNDVGDDDDEAAF